MGDLLSVLGYDEIAAQVAAKLEEGRGIALLEGGPRAGKSWLARDIGSLWKRAEAARFWLKATLLREMLLCIRLDLRWERFPVPGGR